MKRRFGVIFLTIITLLLLAGCGKEEERQLGVDGYVYVAKELQWDAPSPFANFFTAGNFLYYTRYNNNQYSIWKIATDGLTEGTEVLEGEAVLTVSDIFSHAPEEVTELRKGKFSVDIGDYTVDSEQNLYCVAVFYELAGIYTEPAGGVLCKFSADGQPVYWLVLSDAELNERESDILVADDKGGVYLLAGERILYVDSQGQRRESLPVEGIEEGAFNAKRRLLEGTEGRVYYVVDNSQSYRRTTYVLNSMESGLQQVDIFSGFADFNIYEALDGLLIQKSDGKVYRYGNPQNSLDEILNWEDSDLYGSYVRNIVQLTEDQLLVSSGLGEETYYLCTKTPVEELPEKEMIVIASLFPSNLRQSVVDFNRSNDKYHVSIESYGADMLNGDLNEGAYIRLDSSLVSKDVPDLLDMSDLDMSKYMESGTLEDLYTYMDEEGIFSRENYLENLLESYTVDGKLACIPRNFDFSPIFGVGDRMSSIKDWTMPNLMKLTAEYPEVDLFYWLRDSDYLLETFCAPYYLERFVDWENSTCSFDSEEFCDLLRWVSSQEEHLWPEDYLMADSSFGTFYSYEQLLRENEEELYLLGYPSADGRGVLTADVRDALGIVSRSRHKEGAWEFLKFYLSQEDDDYIFPTRKDLLAEMAEDAVTPEYVLGDNGEHFKDKDGNDAMKIKSFFYIDNEEVLCYYLEQERVDAVMEMINLVDFTPRSRQENSIISIVSEEAASFFNGNKPVEEVAAVIQNRVQLLLKENN